MIVLLLLMAAFVSIPQIVSGGTEEYRIRLEGIWLGSLAIPEVQIRLAYRITVAGEDSLIVVHDSPDYGHIDIPVHAAAFDGKYVTFEIGLFDAFFRGEVKDGSIVGLYRAGSAMIPLTLNRVSPDPQYTLTYMVPRLGPDGDVQVAYEYTVPPSGDDSWETAHASDSGIDLAWINVLMNHILSGDYPNIHALLIVKAGKLVVEEYFHGLDAGSLHPIYSITKNVIYNTAGIALENGLLANLDRPVARYFPEYERIFSESRKNEITVEHLVSMTSGLEWDEISTSYFDARNSVHAMNACGNPIEYVLSQPLLSTPGSEFEYNSALPHVLAEIICRSSGMQFTHYVQENLLGPLGIEKFRWDDGAGVLHLRARDLAKLGCLNTYRGRFGDVQLVPETWFKPSMSESSRCSNPSYWNHWGREEFFVQGQPIIGYSGGGFGGQLVFGFPDLDLVVTMFAGNYRGTSADQHEMVREFILPAVMGAQAKQAPRARGVPATAIEDLHWVESTMTRVGCLKACLDYLGRDFSESWVFGASGYAFVLNIEDNVHSRSVGVWNSARSLRLCENLGVTIETISGHRSQPDFEVLQRSAWDKARTALDEGLPCFAFHLKDYEWYVIDGYDRQGYYYQGKDCRVSYGPKCWQELGTIEPNWLEVHLVRPDSAVAEVQTVKAALEFAVEIAFSPENYQYQGFKAGLSGYDQWIQALQENRHDAFGVAYNAAAWTECRSHAAAFLGEACIHVPPDARPLLKEAQAHYDDVSCNLTEVSRIFPLKGILSFELETNARDRDRILQAIHFLKLARDAEADGLEALKKVCESM